MKFRIRYDNGDAEEVTLGDLYGKFEEQHLLFMPVQIILATYDVYT